MGIISYAQNFEDVMLWRTLGDIENGFYIDIGAQHPVVDSVSKAFYDHGWRGIHVEPTAEYANLLRENRPDETVIQSAVSNKSGTLLFFEVPGTGISTAREEIAKEHQKALNCEIVTTHVSAVTLDAVLKLAPTDEIHWLKIDVEGFEKQVLSSWRNSPRRPRIIVVEAIHPNTHIETSSEWEHLILKKGYFLAYKDGLNRFYVHEKHENLSEKLRLPPNVIDEFQTAETNWQARLINRIHSIYVDEITDEKRQLEAHLSNTQTSINELQNKISAQEKSLTEAWKSAEIILDKNSKTNNQNNEFIEDLIEKSLLREEKAREDFIHHIENTEKYWKERELSLEEEKNCSIENLSNAWKREKKELAQQICNLQLESKEQIERERNEKELTIENLFVKEKESSLKIEKLYKKQISQTDKARKNHKKEITLLLKKHKKEEQKLYEKAREQELEARKHFNRLLSESLNHQKRNSDEKLHLLRDSLTSAHEAEIRNLLVAHEKTTTELTKEISTHLGCINRIYEEINSIKSRSRWNRLGAFWSSRTAPHQKEPVNSQELEPPPPLRTSEANTVTEAHETPPCSAPHEPILTTEAQTLMNLDKLLSLNGEDFINSAYSLILGRSADVKGLHYYNKRLNQGFGKGSILYDLNNSAEAKRKKNFKDLEGASNELFIITVYQRVLGRYPDLEGKNHYLSVLNDRTDRKRVIKDIETSEEALRRREQTAELEKDLQYLLREEKFARSWLGKWKQGSRIERRLAILEERVGSSEKSVNMLLSSLNELNGHLTHLTRVTQAPEPPSLPVSPNSPEQCDEDVDLTLAALPADENPEPPVATAEQDLVRGDDRVVLFYVEHTAIFDRITGIQRVCHNLAAMLESSGEKLILVKLDHSTLNFAPLSKAERNHFYTQSGRAGEKLEDRLYEPKAFQQLIASLDTRPIQPWLIIPEVTYHTTHPVPPTSRLIKAARDAGLRVGAIFYDVIPFLTNDAAENALKHANYMSTISLADVIWPISLYSSGLLKDYYQRHEKLSDTELPIISVNPLAEEMDTPRQIQRTSHQHHSIVCVGTIDERKNQISLIKAFNKYCYMHPDTEWKLHLVGLVRDNYRKTIEKEASGNPNIRFHYNASDEDVKSFYLNCDFTVFPSLEEGYGLPVVESLWNLKPCICADFSSMAELQKRGGCIAVDTRSVNEILTAITNLIEKKSLYEKKVQEIISRETKTWYEYAAKISTDMSTHQFGKHYEGIIYYWVDATLEAKGNTGIQRVNRQLSKQLILQGHKLIPIKWSPTKERIELATADDLEYLARWNGPAPTGWHTVDGLDEVRNPATYLMVDLPLNRSLKVQEGVVSYFKEKHAQCVAIFYDAIPVKLDKIYPPQFTSAHKEYMDLLDKMDLVIPISTTSANDLVNYLSKSNCRALSVRERIKAVDLPSEFPEIDRKSPETEAEPSGSCHILVVGTVEPRKNHTLLINSFFEAEKKSKRKLELTLVGGDESFDKDLPNSVTQLIGDAKNIKWIKKASDQTLREQYAAADFTVFPSYEEGFGLPIVESLWFGVPCICSNSGQMAELGAHGGCITVDVTETEDMADAIVDLANNPETLSILKEEIQYRHFKTWSDYAAEVSSEIGRITPLQVTNKTNLVNPEPYKLPKSPLLSVCITTYNRDNWLETNLKNLMHITRKLRDQVEIVVCDNRSEDRTAAVVENYLGSDGFHYYRNSGNIGMLGNLSQTVSLANGEYVWLIGDDDLIHDGALEKILTVLKNEQPELINFNYSYSNQPAPKSDIELREYLRSAATICEGRPTGPAVVSEISSFNENFFTAIYSFLVRKKHAQRIYTQDTSGAPFSSLQTCVPSSKYVLSNLIDLPGFWFNEPLITINQHVSWGKYTLLWILERVPEVYDLAELHGVSQDEVDYWRNHTFQMVPSFFKELFESEYDEAFESFSILDFFRRLRHLEAFRQNNLEFISIYKTAFYNNHKLATISPDEIKQVMQ